MKRTVRLASMFVTMFTGSFAFASGHHLPGYDAYFDAPQNQFRPLSSRAITPEARAGVASIDEKRGVPTIFWAPPSARQAAFRAPTAQPPREAARFYLENYAHLYGLGSGALDSAYIGMVHDTGRGGVIVTFRQRAAGIDVHGVATNVLLTRSIRKRRRKWRVRPSSYTGPKWRFRERSTISLGRTCPRVRSWIRKMPSMAIRFTR